jgi:hypothetical protein
MKKNTKKELFIQYIELLVLLGFDISEALFLPYSKINSEVLERRVNSLKETYKHINEEEYSKTF